MKGEASIHQILELGLFLTFDSDYESEGREFESLRARKSFHIILMYCVRFTVGVSKLALDTVIQKELL
jgi:hypothetical protein